MLADCNRCEFRDIACGDCVITALSDGRRDAPGGAGKGSPPPALGLAERAALKALADAGMVAPLRFSPRRDTVEIGLNVGESVEAVLAVH